MRSRARPRKPETPPAAPRLSGMKLSLHMGTKLHTEILSVYHWVKPPSYEQIVREDLVARLQSSFQSRYYGVQIRSFGSEWHSVRRFSKDFAARLRHSN
ncbi:uncharacterized protein BDW47DRAFT_123704 [Aspergillus candidus]|uniref:Uncharacterized protein n=1 Tax=Aspergillus candidus TaxID=41067 RepID=A0A2I2FHT1_ASPCN|nr:hypothetical protein BDW47DRAFT_123704 [Aspergillus candidus]PLB40191.1 hypothetical protein BDW47DRAFT_123704 [Aspergillus candidus]